MVDYRKADAEFDAEAAAAAAEGGTLRVKMPDKKEGELFGIADALVGGSRLEVMCEDGVKRLARIPGKMKRRMWIREGDLVIVKPWDFQNDKADVVWRYTKTQAEYLSRKNMIPTQIDVFSTSSG
ncbi:MAG TPA: translation initiation factor eIF-1A [Candidatus Thermoplasmatota archaeon]|nr:translation initiation factor eIF-1A [Candidatus Thermoplasmatota archaeon]